MATGKINADEALFTILPQVIKANDNETLGTVLYNWVNALGEVKVVDENKPRPDGIFIEPSMQWLTKQGTLPSKLQEQLANILQNRHRGPGYYIKYAPSGNPDFINEEDYEKARGEDGGLRMLSLFRFWNLIEYFFPSKYLTAGNWDDVLKKSIPEFASAKTDSAYRWTCMKLVSAIHDTHAAAIGGDVETQKYFGRYASPVVVAWVEGYMTVMYHRTEELQKTSLLKPGDRILSINGRDVNKIIDSIAPYTAASNQNTLYNRAITKASLSYTEDNQLTIERNGTKMALVEKYILRNTINTTMRRTYIDYPMYEKMSGDIGYINLGKIKAASLPAIFKAFEETKGLVIDIRNYPSEFMPFALGAYLKPQPSEFVKFTKIDLDLPGRFVMLPALSNGGSNSNTYKNKIVILVNESSISQSEYTAMALRTAPNAIVMGSETAGADGNVSRFTLPGGMWASISGLGVYYPDGRITQGPGIVPDITVKPTAKGISKGRDEVLEAAIMYLHR